MKTPLQHMVLAALAVLSGVSPLSAAVRMPALFADNMVLQQGMPVPVWGWAEPGEPVTVAFAGQVKTATAGDDGRWQVQLDPLKASQAPAELTVSGSNAITLTNVLVGEVWLCGGQSNMGMTLGGNDNMLEAAREIAAATNSAIRHIRVRQRESVVPLDDIPRDNFYGRWTVCSPQEAGRYSAAAYFFARGLADDLDVPIGLVNNSLGATRIEPWISPAGYRMVPELSSFIPIFEAWDPATECGLTNHLEYIARMKDWVTRAEAALAAHRAVPLEPDPPTRPVTVQPPTILFNGMVKPLIPFALRGAIWYQGEGNGNEGITYVHKLKGLIGGWRQLWGQGDFPFYIVQLAGHGVSSLDNPAGGDGFAKIREAQWQATRLIPNTGVAVAIDIGDVVPLHARNKQDVGARLARLALARDYGKPLVPGSPLYTGCTVEGGSIRVAFDHVGAGLMIAEKKGLAPVREIPGGVIQWVSVAGADKAWHWAEAAIEGGTLVVSSPEVPAPVTVRYAFTARPTGPLLYNKDGFPVAPFRTDDW